MPESSQPTPESLDGLSRFLETKDKGIPSRQSEGSACTCASEAEHAEMVLRVDASFLLDYDRHSDRNKCKPTSETMRKRAGASRFITKQTRTPG
jgi:hypothetical protein